VVPLSGPYHRMSFKFEYLGELKVEFETNLGYESGGLVSCFDEKNQR
jgi:hypothetical protein